MKITIGKLSIAIEWSSLKNDIKKWDEVCDGAIAVIKAIRAKHGLSLQDAHNAAVRYSKYYAERR